MRGCIRFIGELELLLDRQHATANGRTYEYPADSTGQPAIRPREILVLIMKYPDEAVIDLLWQGRDETGNCTAEAQDLPLDCLTERHYGEDFANSSLSSVAGPFRPAAFICAGSRKKGWPEFIWMKRKDTAH